MTIHVPARERTPFGQFQLKRSHLRTEIPGARKFAPAQESLPAEQRVEPPPARPADRPAAYRGPCGECGRPMQAQHGPRQPGMVVHDGRGLCQACAQRRRRGGYGAAGTVPDRNTEPVSGGKLPPREVVEQALCAQTDPEAFFPEKGESAREAKAVCSACPVREACLEWALANDERFGVFGGMSERERRALKKKREESAA